MISNYVRISNKGEANRKHWLIVESTAIYQYSANFMPAEKKISSENLNLRDSCLPFPFHLKCTHSKHTVHTVSVNPSLLKFDGNFESIIWFG